MQMAFKEWAVVVEALSTGQQTFLLRKGGVSEVGGSFTLEEEEFVLFPTWEHQRADLIRQEFHKLFNRINQPNSDVLEIQYLAKVTDIFPAPIGIDGMRNLNRYHVWSESFIRMRYDYRPDSPLYVLIPRIYRLASPVCIPHIHRYIGCHSWVRLYDDVNVDGAELVLSDEKFNSARNDLLASLGRR